MHFADRIIEVCREKDSRLVVGLDPHWNLIPSSFKGAHGQDAVADIIGDFLIRAVDACAEHAVAFKPQLAFFEQFGLPGFEALTRVLEALRDRNALVIMDGKRNDIGSTAAAYATAYFGNGQRAAPFPADALTVNPYLGRDGIQPFLEHREKGIFVLVKTSNPSSGDFQDVATAEGKSFAHLVAQSVHVWGEPGVGDSGYSNVGAVVGATWPEHMVALRRTMPKALILVPGYGAQGGSEDAVRAAFRDDGLGALINSSRGILFPRGLEVRGFEAVATAALTARQHINSLTGA